MATIARHHPALGIAFMLAGSFLVTCSDAMNKLLTDRLSAVQIILVESLFVAVALVVMSPWIGAQKIFRVVSWKWQLLRAAVTVAGVFFFMKGLNGLPLSTVGVLSFVNPLFIMALAPALLGERKNIYHWAAMLVGFAGVVVVVQPSTSGFSYLAIYPLASAFCGAVRDIGTRRVGTQDTPQSMIFYSMLGLILAGAVVGRGDLSAVSVHEFPLIVGASVTYLIGLYCVIEAVRNAEASTVVPFRYSNLIWVTAFDVILWGHVPTWNVFAGATMIIGAMLYVFWHERFVRPVLSKS
jgi:S-adenosylmethionine uptake transporter